MNSVFKLEEQSPHKLLPLLIAGGGGGGGSSGGIDKKSIKGIVTEFSIHKWLMIDKPIYCHSVNLIYYLKVKFIL